jgi:hypothetical protein
MSKNEQDERKPNPKFRRWSKEENEERWDEIKTDGRAKFEEQRRSQKENEFLIRLVNNIQVNEKYREMILECHQKARINEQLDGMKILEDPSENPAVRNVTQESSSSLFISFLKHLIELNIELRSKKIVLKRVRERRAERKVIRDAKKEKEIERYKLVRDINCGPASGGDFGRYYQECRRDENHWRNLKSREIIEEKIKKQEEEEENSESEKKFEIELLKLIKADEQYARLIVEHHPHVIKICESLDIDIIQSTPEGCTTNPQAIESSGVMRPQKSYPSSFTTLEEILNEVREAIKEAFKNYEQHLFLFKVSREILSF